MSRFARLAAPLALFGVGSAGVVALALPAPDAKTAAATPAISTPAATPSSSAITREQRASRSEVRAAPSAPAKKRDTGAADGTAKTKVKRTAPTSTTTTKVARPAPALKVTGARYATANVKIRVEPKAKSKAVTVVKRGTRLKVTSSVRGAFRYVSYDSRGRWVTNAYLSKTKPKPVSTKAAGKAASGSGSSGGVTMARCPKGSSMESGLTRDAILVHRTLCARYPQVSSFGGNRNASGFHGSGQAVDCMISNSSVGWAMARWVRAHAKQLGVSEVIYAQKIWTVQRSSEGWRPMSDRGSATANHYDHVHVSVFGNRATG